MKSRYLIGPSGIGLVTGGSQIWDPIGILVLFSWGLLREISFLSSISTMAKMDPAQTADADKARSKYAYEVTKSIARSEGKTLLQCIQDGVVSKPQLMGWNDWQQWRRTTSPKQEVDGFRQDAEEEYRIYSETMQELYGPQWKTGLQTKEAGPVATGTEPLAGEVPTRNPGTSGVAVGSGHASGAREEAGSARSSPRRNGVDDADDVLQGNDPWLGKRLPGSAPPSPMQTSGRSCLLYTSPSPRDA